MPREDTQFKPGKSGNPKGRPKAITFSETVRELLKSQEIQVTWTVNGKQKNLHVKSDKDMNYGIAAALIMESLKGEVKAAQELVNRAEGRAVDRVQMTHTGSMAISFEGRQEEGIDDADTD